jgi:hypothetical protein
MGSSYLGDAHKGDGVVHPLGRQVQEARHRSSARRFVGEGFGVSVVARTVWEKASQLGEVTRG